MNWTGPSSPRPGITWCGWTISSPAPIRAAAADLKFPTIRLLFCSNWPEIYKIRSSDISIGKQYRNSIRGNVFILFNHKNFPLYGYILLYQEKSLSPMRTHATRFKKVRHDQIEESYHSPFRLTTPYFFLIKSNTCSPSEKDEVPIKPHR